MLGGRHRTRQKFNYQRRQKYEKPTLDLNDVGGDPLCWVCRHECTVDSHQGLQQQYVAALVVDGTKLFAGTIGGRVFFSTNEGTTWIPAGNGLPGSEVYALAMNGADLFAGTIYGVFRSTDSGTNWIAANAGMSTAYVYSVGVLGSNLFAGSYANGTFHSTNGGISWSSINNGLTCTDVRAMASNGINLFGATSLAGVFVTTNNGTTWAAANTGLTCPYDYALAVGSTSVFVGTYGGGVFTSTNNGGNWTQCDSVFSTNIFALATIPNGSGGVNVFAGCIDGVFLSTDNGRTWISVNTGFTAGPAWSLTIIGGNLFVGTFDGVWKRPLSEMITSVPEPYDEVPTAFRLEQNYPNPFNPTTAIRFSISQSRFASLKVFDLLGKTVATLLNDNVKSGSYEVVFDATQMTSGVYFYRLQSDNLVQTRRLLLLK